MHMATVRARGPRGAAAAKGPGRTRPAAGEARPAPAAVELAGADVGGEDTRAELRDLHTAALVLTSLVEKRGVVHELTMEHATLRAAALGDVGAAHVRRHAAPRTLGDVANAAGV
jgi:hypothetical protein